MKIIIVEDDENKYENIIKFLKENYSIENELHFDSYQSAIKKIINMQSDDVNLILLDMSMSTFSITSFETGGRKRPFAGKEILEQMKWNDVQIPVIVITAYETFEEQDGQTYSLEELCSLMKNKYSNYIGCVYYDSSQRNWMEQLKIFMKDQL